VVELKKGKENNCEKAKKKSRAFLKVAWTKKFRALLRDP
jgi:hypothetical protein